jgi:hypothetical protein
VPQPTDPEDPHRIELRPPLSIWQQKISNFRQKPLDIDIPRPLVYSYSSKDEAQGTEVRGMKKR